MKYGLLLGLLLFSVVCFAEDKDSVFIEQNINKLVPHDDKKGFEIWEKFYDLVKKNKDKRIIAQMFNASLSSDGAATDNLAEVYERIFNEMPNFFVSSFFAQNAKKQKRVMTVFAFGLLHKGNYKKTVADKLKNKGIKKADRVKFNDMFLNEVKVFDK